jgi:hypothetical protein
MHTPRFSGQPISAGDLVFERTPSLPMRTSCENVGTVVPRFSSQLPLTRRQVEQALARCARTKNARAHTYAERYCESGENQQETPHTIQETDVQLSVSNRRGLLGFSGLAPHSGRSSIPFRRSLFWDRRISFQPAYPLIAEGRTARGNSP